MFLKKLLFVNKARASRTLVSLLSEMFCVFIECEIS
jgi:hypothetical protein